MGARKHSFLKHMKKDEIIILSEIHTLVEEAQEDGTSLACEIAVSQIRGMLENYFLEKKEEMECEQDGL